ncbi:hypothetical protein [Cellulomonas sp. KRMCY2]|uniref:hypothetical protein n=1 Tax=Cellulomonas sp. KRMCY2 TaxID=1304865 RepID=UPI00045EB171|nr:hypothetical protein [Cellulomonas sp. KRMCY2]
MTRAARTLQRAGALRIGSGGAAIPAEAHQDRLIQNGMSTAMAQGMRATAMAKDADLDDGAVRTPQRSTPATFRQWCQDVLKPAVLA